MSRKIHDRSADRTLGLGCPIVRRDLLKGAAVGVAASLAPELALAHAAEENQDAPGDCPPLLNGTRGSHPDAFEV